MDTLFYIGLILVLGSFMKWVSHKFKILNVVGYIVLGFLIGPDNLDIVSKEFVQNSHIVIDLSLALISVLVGANLRYNVLKSVWKQIIVISVSEAIFTFFMIGSVFYMLFEYFELGYEINYRLTTALIFGALASATAPATILAVIHELKAKSRFSSYLLGVVATDNAMTLILFSFVMIVSKTTADVDGQVAGAIAVIAPMLLFTVLLGIAGAFLSEGIDRVFKNYKSIKTTSTLGMIFLVYSISRKYGLDPLLSSLVMGVVMSNLSNEFFLVKKEFDQHLKDIIFLLFFTISAMHLNIYVLLSMPFVVIMYVLFRIAGKILGVWYGGKISGAAMEVRRYLGLALFPQAGIAIGLALSIQENPDFIVIAPIVLNIIIATTMVHELIGPLLTRYVLQKNMRDR